MGSIFQKRDNYYIIIYEYQSNYISNQVLSSKYLILTRLPKNNSVKNHINPAKMSHHSANMALLEGQPQNVWRIGRSCNNLKAVTQTPRLSDKSIVRAVLHRREGTYAIHPLLLSPAIIRTPRALHKPASPRNTCVSTTRLACKPARQTLYPFPTGRVLPSRLLNPNRCHRNLPIPRPPLGNCSTFPFRAARCRHRRGLLRLQRYQVHQMASLLFTRKSLSTVRLSVAGVV